MKKLVFIFLIILISSFIFAQSSPSGFVLIPYGTFTMGSPTSETRIQNRRNETQRQVTISSFYMGKYEVTQAEYQEVMGRNPGHHPQTHESILLIYVNRPVIRISWFDAIEYCNRLSQRDGLIPAYEINGNEVTWNRNANGYRLPTEAEWEYACRAGTITAYNTGAEISDDTGWYDANSGNTTHDVGLKPPNAWGLYDMHGNVCEYCWDWFGDYANGVQTNPIGATTGTGRVVRGGSYLGGELGLRSAYRASYSPNDRSRNNIGIRVVRNAQ